MDEFMNDNGHEKLCVLEIASFLKFEADNRNVDKSFRYFTLVILLIPSLRRAMPSVQAVARVQRGGCCWRGTARLTLLSGTFLSEFTKLYSGTCVIGGMETWAKRESA